MSDTHSIKKSFFNLTKTILILFFVQFVASCTSSIYNAHYATASWYGPKFHGNQTSSGEIFNMYAYTCAHKEYPFGSLLKVTNLSNGKSVKCIVNDRGPFADGRDIDLSYASARQIGLIGEGVANVRIDYLGRDSSYLGEVSSFSANGPFTLQVGSFRRHENALNMKRILEMKYQDVYVQEARIKGKHFYRVRIGNFDQKDYAEDIARKLADEGYRVLITTHRQDI